MMTLKQYIKILFASFLLAACGGGDAGEPATYTLERTDLSIWGQPWLEDLDANLPETTTHNIVFTVDGNGGNLRIMMERFATDDLPPIYHGAYLEKATNEYRYDRGFFDSCDALQGDRLTCYKFSNGMNFRFVFKHTPGYYTGSFRAYKGKNIIPATLNPEGAYVLYDVFTADGRSLNQEGCNIDGELIYTSSAAPELHYIDKCASYESPKTINTFTIVATDETTLTLTSPDLKYKEYIYKKVRNIPRFDPL